MDWISENAWAAWLGLAAILGVLEMFSFDLVLAMLAFGALIGMVLAFADVHWAIQVLGAAAAAVAALAVVRPSVAKRLHGGPELTHGHDRLIGAQGRVTEEISPLHSGRIHLAGEVWSAVPYDDTLTIPAGESVEVLEIRGATAVVYPVATLGPGGHVT